jgi:hypothetical protein
VDQKSVSEEGAAVIATIFVWPILPGKQEAWRRFCQVLVGRHINEYMDSRRRLGITKELIWLAQTPESDLAIMYVEVQHPKDTLVQLGASTHPFDRWLHKQLLELHGLNLTQPVSHPANELVLVWQVP